jgi:hypothetical protein
LLILFIQQLLVLVAQLAQELERVMEQAVVILYLVVLLQLVAVGAVVQHP